ncbi:MAG: pyridine nucleotide-disulfide oxidoreductase, partial [Chitinivibrionales bacterium]|nr:pyridine nucleotide-disulfide oxidoreductase [Chitinivibrionales bacterium]MBD3357729.1 pyridine nucleotide-disulfide oxidoreductase [Chitinivibrionales bacterium]
MTERKRITVVGGVAGGASFAARMRRLDERARITLYERGEHISFANCGLPYHIGDTIKNRDDLIIQTPEKFRRRYAVEVQTRNEVVAVHPARNTIEVESNGEKREEPYDYLVLSPGSAPIRPPIPGIDDPRILTLRNIADMDRIRALVDERRAQRTVVVGGGFIGLEMAENLRHRGGEVTLIEMAKQVFAPADPEMAAVIQQHLTLNGVTLALGDAAQKFVDKKCDGIEVALQSGKTIEADAVILAIGVRPDTHFLTDSDIALTRRGAIEVDAHMRTNHKNIFAVGDAVEVVDFISGRKVHVPLAGPANRQGRIAADTIAGIESTYKATQGTAICKVFDLTVAVTGLNEKNAKTWDIPHLKSYTHGADHAGYYPGAFPLSIKILFSPDDGRLLGAQVVGKNGIDKRIDVLATALRHGLTIYDLAELELAYAPPYGSAKDPVNMAGFVAQNILEKRMPVAFAEEIASSPREDRVILDVRTRTEHENGAIEGSINIPIDELRERLGELDKAKEHLVYCQVGLRGYLATRTLLQEGFRAANLSGGYKTYSTLQTADYDSSYVSPTHESTCSSPTGEESNEDRTIVDATGRQCPGPIMQLKKAVDQCREGQEIEIRATDQGFALDVPSWCNRTQNTLMSLVNEGGVFKAIIRKGRRGDACTVPQDGDRNKTMVIFSNDLDRLMAAFIIANGAASMGSSVSLFFTFWGLNLLRKDNPPRVDKALIERMFSMMMPRGAGKTGLSKMHMGGAGTAMMKQVMKAKNVLSLESLVHQAQE